MRSKLLALCGATAVALVGAVAFAAGPAQAAAPAVTSTSVRTGDHNCEFPDTEIKALAEVSVAKAPAAVSGVISEIIGCIELEVVDKCDGRTVITLTNWAVSDNKWTRLTVKILGQEYVVKGGPDHTPVVITLGPPPVEDVQAYVVFEFNGWHIEKPVGDPYSWEKPSACVDESPSPSSSPSPSPSVSVSPSVSPSVTTTTASSSGPLYDNCTEAEAAGVTPISKGEAGYSSDLDGDADGVACEADDIGGGAPLPTTGDSLTKPALTGGVAAALGALLLLSVFLKRRRTANEIPTQK